MGTLLVLLSLGPGYHHPLGPEYHSTGPSRLPRLTGLLVTELVVRSTSCGCSARTWWSISPRGAARHGVGRPLCLVWLLGRDLVVCSASRGCLSWSWASALPRVVARHGLGHLLRLVWLLDSDLVVCFALGLLDGDMVIRFASRGCMVGSLSFAPPRVVA
jgi:hypothetical protein